jgi:hypothetical protein
MGETCSRSEIEALWRERLKGALRQLNSATLHVHEAQQEYCSRAIPSPDGDHAFWRALRAETVARREYMNVLMTLQNLVLHGTIPPSENTSKKKANDAASGRD